LSLPSGPSLSHSSITTRWLESSPTLHVKSWRDGSIKHLLAGIAECGVCSAPCRRVKNRNTPSYACTARFCVTRSQQHLDQFVTIGGGGQVVPARCTRTTHRP
jgi:hypothetical protein